MRFIPTTLHGIMDYVMGVLLIALPWLIGFSDNRPATMTLVVLGVGMLLLAACTDYEYGLVRLIPMPVHLMIDAVSGAILAASPWLFGFADRIWIPHLILGLGEMAAAMVSQTRPGALGRLSHRLGL